MVRKTCWNYLERMHLPAMVCLTLVIALSGCARHGRMPASRRVYTGEASWYGRQYHGKKTASGERFNMNARTAAHPYLPFGTRVRVTHLGNGRTVIVRINDRGPFIKNRVIDLSYKAARSLSMVQEGVAMVRLEILD